MKIFDEIVYELPPEFYNTGTVDDEFCNNLLKNLQERIKNFTEDYITT